MKSVKKALMVLAAAALLAAGGCSRKPKDLYSVSFADLMQYDAANESVSLNGEETLQLLAASCLQTAKQDEPDGWMVNASWNYGLEQAACISQDDRVLVLNTMGGWSDSRSHPCQRDLDREGKETDQHQRNSEK